MESPVRALVGLNNQAMECRESSLFSYKVVGSYRHFVVSVCGF